MRRTADVQAGRRAAGFPARHPPRAPGVRPNRAKPFRAPALATAAVTFPWVLRPAQDDGGRWQSILVRSRAQP